MIEFKHLKVIKEHPDSVALFHRAHADMIKNNDIDGLMELSILRKEAIEILHDGKPIAFTYFYILPKQRHIAWVNLSYVEPAYRGVGWYSALVEALRTHLRGRGVIKIQSKVMKANEKMLAIHKRKRRIVLDTRSGPAVTFELTV